MSPVVQARESVKVGYYEECLLWVLLGLLGMSLAVFLFQHFSLNVVYMHSHLSNSILNNFVLSDKTQHFQILGYFILFILKCMLLI